MSAPNQSQIAASDPRRSNWVSANAGSGKTHVLSLRVARLLLDGAEPGKILCLTYTKAAAAEMQNRLFRLLGTWAMLPPEALAREMADLEGRDAPVDDPARLAEARRLFARALETPGGLKIQTIHALCDALLRRFPIEAGVSPQFEVTDERDTARMLARIREEMAADAEAGTDPAFDIGAARLDDGGFDALLHAVLNKRGQFGGNAAERIAAAFGAEAARGEDAVLDEARERLVRTIPIAFADLLQDKGGKREQSVAAALRSALGPDRGPLRDICAAILLKSTPLPELPASGFPTKPLAAADTAGHARVLGDWAVETELALRSAANAARTADLYRFAQSILTRYGAAKAARARLDFDDLIDRVHELLTRSHMAAWVLYKLDLGVDHILVDEAQDTAPRQWQVIGALIDEFHAGHSARSEARSIFVVGDEKQSIYSFQGADPQAFGDMRARVGTRLDAIGAPLGRPDLLTSFRSAPAILDVVDAVFDGADAGLGAPVRHIAHRRDAPGRVDLWPLVEADPPSEPPPWDEPVDAPQPGNPKDRLAGMLAGEIARMCASERLPDRDGRGARPVRPGDILVLVTRRDRLAHGIIRQLKARGVAVAGADRLSLAAELAVRDLMALMRFATDPGDDLTLACLLRSPLCSVSEEALFTLAHGREGPLLEALRRSGHTREIAFLDDMLARADLLRPFEFLERALRLHDGRRRLLARLGPEAEDPVDELLTQALVYESRDVPTLTGFLSWIDSTDIPVKREMDSTADHVRVMTVHGAKGLEAPIVILPDTMTSQKGRGGQVLLPADGIDLMLWPGPAAARNDDPVTAAARAAVRRREEAERARLLYVAMTRAEDWLVLCGAGREAGVPGTWYERLSETFEGLGGVGEVTVPGVEGPVRRYQTSPGSSEAAGPAPATPEAADPQPPDDPVEPRPAWLGQAPREDEPPRLVPSSLGPAPERGGEGLGAAPARLRGLAVHLILERIDPAADPARRRAEALRLVARAFPGADAPGALAEAEAVLALPEARPLFAPDAEAEVSIALPVPGAPRKMIGRIDRLARSGDTLWVVDFKTDRPVPAAPEDVAPRYLAQLGVYRRAICGIYPGRTVRAGLLWTAGPRLMWLPDALVEHAVANALGGA